MAAVTVIHNGVDQLGNRDAWEDVAQGLGHTVTLRNYASVTGTSENGQDLIVVCSLDESEWQTITAHLLNYHDGTSPATGAIPIIVVTMSDLNGIDDDIPDGYGDSPASALGMVGSLLAARDNYGDQQNIPGLAFDFEYRDIPGLQAMGGVVNPVWIAAANNPQINHAALSSTPYAGKRWLSAVLPNGETRVVGVAVEIGDEKVNGLQPATFAERGVWAGISGQGGYGGDIQWMIAAIRYCLAEHVSTYPTTSGAAVIRLPSIDISEAGKTYEDSAITWDSVLPTNTSITVETSLDGETWSTVASSGDPIPGLTIADPMDAVRLYVRVELATTDGVSTPEFSNLRVRVDLQGATLTTSPTDYFSEGRVTWLTGANAGRSMEVKTYSVGTRTVELELEMPFDIAVGDTFEIYPGCQKRFAEDCVARFNNGANFQGEPHVPGEDVQLKSPDARF